MNCNGCKKDYSERVMSEEGYCPRCESHRQELYRQHQKREQSNEKILTVDQRKARIGDLLKKDDKDKEERRAITEKFMEHGERHVRRVERHKGAVGAREGRYSEEILNTKAKKTKITEQVKLARKELAVRELAKRHLLPYVKYTMPGYVDGWVHRDLCRRLEKFSAQVARGESPRLMIQMPPRHGKAISHETLILTSEGWSTHGDISVGDHVLHPNGYWTRVQEVSTPTELNVEVEFSNGQKIVCHENHEWAVHDRRKSTNPEKNLKTLETKELEKQVWLAPSGSRGSRARWQLPFIETAPFEEKKVSLDPYVLGVWLGDGTTGEPAITNSEGDSVVFQREFEYAGFYPSNVYVHSEYGTHRAVYWKGAFAYVLKELGVFSNKHIPEVYLRGSIDQRKELLAGLIDTDGHVEEDTGRCRFVTTSEELRDGVFDLATTLGYSPYVVEVEPTTSSSGVKGQKTVYTVGFQPTEYLPLRIPRKNEAQEIAKRRRVSIKSIRRVEPRPGKCIQVDSPDGLYCIGEKLVPTHNSLLATQKFPAWHLGKYGNHEFIVASYSASLANKFSKLTRAMIRGEDHRNVFPESMMDENDASVEGWSTTQGGSYFPTGVGGPATGYGANVLVIDDPVKNREEADSETVREAIKDWYTSTAYTRLSPGGGVLCIQTRWNDDDLSGWLEHLAEIGEGDEWEIVRYPAIAIKDETHRKKGEALHEDRYPLEALQRIKRAIGQRDWNALYQQNPVPDGGDFFKKDDLRFYHEQERPPLDELAIYAAADFAIGDKQENDSTVIYIAGIDRDMRMWILDRYKGQWGTLGIIKHLCLAHNTWYPEMFGGERGHIEMTLNPVLNEYKYKDPYNAPGLFMKPLKPGKNDKKVRARPLQGMIEHHQVYFPANAPWLADAMQELLRFPMGRHDDDVDSLAWLGKMIELFTPVPLPRVEKPKSWKDKLSKYVAHGKGSRRGSPMSA